MADRSLLVLIKLPELLLTGIFGIRWRKYLEVTVIILQQNGKPLLDGGKIEILSVAKLLSSAIKSIHDETSVSSLFI